MAKELVSELIIKQDIGSFESYDKKVVIQLWDDGSMTWRARENPAYAHYETYVGDPDWFGAKK